MQINPKLLTSEKQVNGKARQAVSARKEATLPQRNGLLSMVALVKRAVIDGLKSETLSVKVNNGKEFETALNRVVGKIDVLNNTIKSLPKIDMGDSPASINIQTMSEKTIARLTEQLDEVKKAVLATKPEKSPAVQKVQVTNHAPVAEFPVEKIIRALIDVERAVSNIRLEVPKHEPMKMPEMPKSLSINEGKAIIKALEAVSKKLDELPKSFPEIQIPSEVSVNNFPPQKYPLPVTNININPLRGEIKSTSVTVTTALTPLPGEVLSYRRGVVIYNNSSTVTMYIGGSTMLAADGMPVPPNSYSPAFDAGPKMIIYGRTASGTANARVLELSNENIGG